MSYGIATYASASFASRMSSSGFHGLRRKIAPSGSTGHSLPDVMITLMFGNSCRANLGELRARHVAVQADVGHHQRQIAPRLLQDDHRGFRRVALQHLEARAFEQHDDHLALADVILDHQSVAFRSATCVCSLCAVRIHQRG